MLETDAAQITLDLADLPVMLGPARPRHQEKTKAPVVGVARGMAYTPFGGDMLDMEALIMPGNGALQLTGQLGDVMQESARAVMSYIRARAADFGLMPDFQKTLDAHIHVPEGAIPKDGPSAGVTLTCALISAYTGIPARQDIAMTGEITLRGRVLPVGGVKEKLLAAHRAGLREVILPKENEPDLEEIPKTVRGQLQIHSVERIDEMLQIALTRQPTPWVPVAQAMRSQEARDGH
jgi:ATP-dependent Lon protease